MTPTRVALYYALTMTDLFAPRTNKGDIEQGDRLAPKFAQDGTIPCVTTHADTGEVLMVAYMNAEALSKTIETGEVYYWSRSRNKLWKKGELSGLTQKVRQMLVDCDQDCIVLKVELGTASADPGVQASCHVGYRNCFYREVELGGPSGGGPAKLKVIGEKVFDPDVVYAERKN